MAVALPRGGGGLDTWNVTPEDVTRAVHLGLEPDLDKIKDRKFKTYHPYRRARWRCIRGSCCIA